MIIKGDFVKLINPIPGFEMVGDMFHVENIVSGKMDMIQIACSYGRGVVSCDGFNDYFSKVKTFSWTDWENVFYNNIVYQYRTNGKRVMVKRNGVKASASCHPHDNFNLETGIAICSDRLATKTRKGAK